MKTSAPADKPGGPGSLNAQHSPAQALRYAVVTLLVATWVALGFAFHLTTNTYLLIGMPITLLFQLLIARRPLRELWLAQGQALRFDRWTVAWLLLFLIGPLQAIVSSVRSSDWVVTIYGVAALIGAIGAALAFRALGRSNLWQLGLLMLIMLPIGLARLLIQQMIGGEGLHDLEIGNRLLEEVQSLLFYVPAVFVAEEVFFRGALDSYLHRHELGAGWGSAAFVSILWGLWHTPIAGHLSLFVVLELVVAQLIVGMILSTLWRRTGNLAVPGTTHAVLDALRNALAL